MRTPLPFLLYVVALGLFGWAGWTFYKMLPMWERGERDKASSEGINTSQRLLAKGHESGPISVEWRYHNRGWWDGFKQVNLVGKLPPKAPTPEEIQLASKPKTPMVDLRPLEEIIELVSLVCDSNSEGKGGISHVVVRYLPAANVEPPEWWIRENTPPSASGGTTPLAGRDIASSAPTTAPLTSRPQRPTAPPRPGTAPTTAMPTSMSGREILQWLGDDGDPHHGVHLWPKFEHIRLVRVAPNCQSAWFVREVPAGEDGTVPEPKEEQLFKTTAKLSQALLRELATLQGRDADANAGRGASGAAQPTNAWREVDVTTRFNDGWHIGRQDQERFRANTDEFLNNLYVETYHSTRSNLTGLQVRNVETQIGSRFGVAVGDVLLEINGRAVESKAQAVNQVSKDYERGVRTFVTKWLSSGQIVERSYQAPEK